MTDPRCFPPPSDEPTGPPAVPAEAPKPAPAGPSPYGTVWLDEMPSAAGSHEPPWVWRGYLARGHITLMTSQWKMGKTTLLAVLLSRMAAGGALAGLGVASGRAAVVSEEPHSLWAPRIKRLGLGRQVCLISRPFPGKPTLAQWLELLAHLRTLHRQYGLALVVIDTLGELLPAGAESGAEAGLAALLPLRRLTAEGVAVLLLHHPRKGGSADGQAARGSGVLSAHADVLTEMHWYTRGAETDRRRRLLAWSRLEGTPRQLVIELNAEGTDYLAHGDFEADEFAPAWGLLRRVLERAPDRLTRAEIRRAWPEAEAAPSRATLGRWLERAAEQGLVLRDGQGHAGDPYRYWLKEREAAWAADPLRQLEMQQEEARRLLKEQFGIDWGR